MIIYRARYQLTGTEATWHRYHLNRSDALDAPQGHRTEGVAEIEIPEEVTGFLRRNFPTADKKIGTLSPLMGLLMSWDLVRCITQTHPAEHNEAGVRLDIYHLSPLGRAVWRLSRVGA